MNFALVHSVAAPALARALSLRSLCSALSLSTDATTAAFALLSDLLQAFGVLAVLQLARRASGPAEQPQPATVFTAGRWPAQRPPLLARPGAPPLPSLQAQSSPTRPRFSAAHGPDQLRSLALALCCFPLLSLSAELSSRAFQLLSGGAAEALSLECSVGDAVCGDDPIAASLYFALVALVSPAWEEPLFRGYMLPALSALFARSPQMAAALAARGVSSRLRGAVDGAALGASALLFALAHGCGERVLPLGLLGVLLGKLWLRARRRWGWGENECTALAVGGHAAWNVWSFLELALLGAYRD